MQLLTAPWIVTDPFAEQLARDEAARDAEEQAAAVRKHLQSLGWRLDIPLFGKPDGYVHPDNWEWRVDLSGDNAYLWTLQQFSDADDADGVARGRWKDREDVQRGTVEGDTLASLLRALRCTETGRFPADWDAEPRYYGADAACDRLHADRDGEIDAGF